MKRGIVDCMPTNTQPDTRPKCNHKTVCGSPLLTHPGRQARAVVLAQVLQQPVAAQELHGQAVQQAAMVGGRRGKGRRMLVLLIAAGAWRSVAPSSCARPAWPDYAAGCEQAEVHSTRAPCDSHGKPRGCSHGEAAACHTAAVALAHAGRQQFGPHLNRCTQSRRKRLPGNKARQRTKNH